MRRLDKQDELRDEEVKLIKSKRFQTQFIMVQGQIEGFFYEKKKGYDLGYELGWENELNPYGPIGLRNNFAN